MSGCLSLYVGPVIDWRPVKGITCLLPNASWDRLQHHCDPLRISGIDNGWMDGWMGSCAIIVRPALYLETILSIGKKVTASVDVLISPAIGKEYMVCIYDWYKVDTLTSTMFDVLKHQVLPSEEYIISIIIELI